MLVLVSLLGRHISTATIDYVKLHFTLPNSNHRRCEFGGEFREPVKNFAYIFRRCAFAKAVAVVSRVENNAVASASEN